MVEEAVTRRALAYLQLLVSRGQLDLDDFDSASTRVVQATSLADIEKVVRAAPKMWVEADADTAADRARIVSRARGVKLSGRAWSLARETEVAAGAANMILDLSRARVAGPVVDLTIATGVNRVTILVPEWIDVVAIEQTGSLAWHMPERPRLPGLPLVRLRVRGGLGKVIVKPAGPRRWLGRLWPNGATAGSLRPGASGLDT